MRTIGRRHRRRTPGGDHLSQCSECCAPDLRSKLVRLDDGNLYHRSGGCQPSRTALSLSRGNAEKARGRQYGPADGAVSLENNFTDQPVGTPANLIVGYAWCNVDGTIRASSPGITVTSGSLGDYELQSPVDFDFVEITHYDTARHTAGHLPLWLSAGKTGTRTAEARLRNRFDGTGGLGGVVQFFVLFYGEPRSPMLTNVSTIWIKGSTPEILAYEGAAVSIIRTPGAPGDGSGSYTVTLQGGATYRFATISQYIQGDPTGVTPIFTGVGQIDGSTAGVVLHLNNGNPTDGDVCVRFLG